MRVKYCLLFENESTEDASFRLKFRHFGQQTAVLSISSICYQDQTLETTMKRFLRSLLAGTMQAVRAVFRAVFTFNEWEARILASAYRLPPPEIQDWQDSRPYENASRVSTLRKMKLSQWLTSPYGPIPLGMHPELIRLTLGPASRKRL